MEDGDEVIYNYLKSDEHSRRFNELVGPRMYPYVTYDRESGWIIRVYEDSSIEKLKKIKKINIPIIFD